jgi:transketolase
MRNAFVHELEGLASSDRSVVLITGDLGFGVLTSFAARFPDQYVNAGVAEQNMLGLATGLALERRIVFVYSIANFPTLRCLEQVRNDACYHNANVKIVAVGAGFSYGSLGASHHATEDLAILRAIPNLTIFSPGDAWEAAAATRAAYETPGTCYLRIDRAGAPSNGVARGDFRAGVARVLRDGQDVSLLATGGILAEVVAAADVLGRQGIGARVLSMHTVQPLDVESIGRACRETGGIVTVEEHTLRGGLGSAVAEACLDNNWFPGFFKRIGIHGVFAESVGSQNFLRQAHKLDASAIIETVNLAIRARRSRPGSS